MWHLLHEELGRFSLSSSALWLKLVIKINLLFLFDFYFYTLGRDAALLEIESKTLNFIILIFLDGEVNSIRPRPKKKSARRI